MAVASRTGDAGAGVPGDGVSGAGGGAARPALRAGGGGGGDVAHGAARQVEELAVGEAVDVAARAADARREPGDGLVDTCAVGGRGARRGAGREDGGQGWEVAWGGGHDDWGREVVVGYEAGAEGAVFGGRGRHLGWGWAMGRREIGAGGHGDGG